MSKLLVNKRFLRLLKNNGIKINIVEQEDIIPPGTGPIRWPRTDFKYADAAGKVFFGKFTYSTLFDSDEHFSTFKLQCSADGRNSTGLQGSYVDWK